VEESAAPTTEACKELTSLAFLGTPDAAVTPLRALHAAGHDIRIVVTRADRRRGRGSTTGPSPVKRAALDLGLPVTDRIDDVIDSGAELGVVVAFGRIIRPHVLAAVPLINLHFSLLPRWRGAAPVERAILAGDTETGVCLMTLDEGLDTGPIHACRVVPIGPEETADELRATLVEEGTDLLLQQLRDGLAPAVPQNGTATYAAKIEPSELRLDWTQPAVQLHRVMRLGRAWTTFRGRRLRVVRARVVPSPQAGDGAKPGELLGLVVRAGQDALELVEVQPEGRAPMSASDWRRGAHPKPDELLGQ
jgi:methionyl-tRNA formyltransferase